MQQFESTPNEVLTKELEPSIQYLYDRHMGNTKTWYPHLLIPYSDARDYSPDELWVPEDSPLEPGLRSALEVNLLTEDNLPHYFETIKHMIDSDIWRAWSNQWTAEEMRHSIVIRGYIEARRLIDPVKLENDRMAQVSGGKVPRPSTIHKGIAYVALQELATRVSHANVAKHLAKVEDKVGEKVMSTVAGDEHLHYFFYVDLGADLIEIDPSSMMIAVANKVIYFDMPGTGIPGFQRHAAAIAKAGIYDLEAFVNKVARKVLNRWEVWDLEGLNEEAKIARDGLWTHLDSLDKKIERRSTRREKTQIDA